MTSGRPTSGSPIIVQPSLFLIEKSYTDKVKTNRIRPGEKLRSFQWSGGWNTNYCKVEVNIYKPWRWTLDIDNCMVSIQGINSGSSGWVSMRSDDTSNICALTVIGRKNVSRSWTIRSLSTTVTHCNQPRQLRCDNPSVRHTRTCCWRTEDHFHHTGRNPRDIRSLERSSS